MKNIWIRIGEYGTTQPFIVSDFVCIEENDPIIRTCVKIYSEFLRRNGIEIKKPVQVIVKSFDK